MQDEYNVGTIKISEEVIAGITNMAACEVDGVSKIVVKGISNAKALVENYKSPVKGVSIATTLEGLEITFQIAVKQGFKIQDVAKKVQSNVSDSIQNMTGLKTKAVNVIVVNVIDDVEQTEKDE